MSSTTPIATVHSAALTGYTGERIEVETDISIGLPSLQIVGMGNKAIDEARQRVRSAITHSLLDFPSRKVTVNLAPAELPKDGTHLDLPIALSILVASGQLQPSDVSDSLFAGELALDGTLRPIRGSISITETALRSGAKRVYLPAANAAQATLIQGVRIIPITSLTELFKILKSILPPPLLSTPELATTHTRTPTLDSITGHAQAKRALAIAAAGRHNILFSGPPGSGKTLLCKALPSLLPTLTPEESLEVTKLHSLSASIETVQTTPPFRAPHHGITISALIGGGLHPRPGDISLAHKGVLFLDEFPEYSRSVTEALRQPLEDRSITLSRLYGRVTFPADFLLAATMNPCPCGYWGSSSPQCTCTPRSVAAYQQRISGPLLDRIDLRMTISKIPTEHILSANTLKEKQHSEVLEYVSNTRKAQRKRYKRRDFYNAYASLSDIKTVFEVSPEAQLLAHTASNKLNLSTRSYVKVLRVARTIADLESSPAIMPNHIAEALQFRGSDTF